ncbi:unknown [Feldmannia species virus]|uniref:Uncharacterized protein n=1 Tax=Feldmannia species virus TaxID=39420 RepID=B5LWK8_9PHYC|nr:hypothetical protein FeldSpV_gp119 [Feldmannia species virus]ACH46871.1 unknown [Feldmannia species virus]
MDGFGDILARDVTSSGQRTYVNDNELCTTAQTQALGEDGALLTFAQEASENVLGEGHLVLRTLGVDGNLGPALDLTPGQTRLCATAAVDSTGLYFDSDDSAIYFGASKTFRIIFSDRLLFQYLDGSTGEYVTKLSFTK